MIETVFPDCPHSDADRAASIFNGNLVIYRQVAALRPLLALAMQRLTHALGGRDPQRAHAQLAPADYDKRMGELGAAWRRDPDVRAGWAAVYQAIGLDLDDACYDWFYVRMLPPGKTHLGRHTPCLPPHRDTWGSNVFQQINWWAPVYPLSAENAMVIYPDYWRCAIANTSAEWDLAELRRLPPERRRDYPNLPDIREVPENPMPILLEPGDILAFSAQHLHASQHNPSDVARINIECRTVCVADVNSHRCAPNIDGATPRKAWDWFKRLTDGTPLPDLVDARPD